MTRASAAHGEDFALEVEGWGQGWQVPGLVSSRDREGREDGRRCLGDGLEEMLRRCPLGVWSTDAWMTSLL